MSDRDLALENVRYVRDACAGLTEDFVPARDGFIAQRARQVLGESVELLERIADEGLFEAIADGTFGVTRRPADGGRGLDGVVRREDGVLAGSTLTMPQAVRNLVAAGAPLEQALESASTVPARVLGIPDLGRLFPGGPADIVVIDDRVEVVRAIVGGETRVAG